MISATVLLNDYQQMVAMQSTPEMEISTALLKGMIKNFGRQIIFIKHIKNITFWFQELLNILQKTAKAFKDSYVLFFSKHL